MGCLSGTAPRTLSDLELAARSAFRHRAWRSPGPRAKLDIGGGGGGSGIGSGFFGRASRRFRIISSLVFWNFGVPGLTPAAATISSVISSDAGRYFWK